MGLASAIRLRARSLAAISNRIKAQCSTKAKLSTAASDSPAAEYVTVTQHDDRTATLTMNHPPVNSLSLEMLQALRDAFVDLDASGCRGFVLASSRPTIFSAGLDITELHNPSEARLREFWSTLQDAFLALYGSRCATVAAIDGHSPAGGCLLAACCDERIMVRGKWGIGLNETQLGIVAPFWFADAMRPLMGQRRLDRMLQLGQLLSPDEALAAGLVDELEEHGSGAVLARAREVLGAYVAIDAPARADSKLLLRAEALDRLRARKQDNIDFFVACCMSERYQSRIGAYLDALRERKKR